MEEIKIIPAPPQPPTPRRPLTLGERFARLKEEQDYLLRQRVPPRGTNLFFDQGEDAQRLLDYWRDKVHPLAEEQGGEALAESLRWGETLGELWDFYWGER